MKKVLFLAMAIVMVLPMLFSCQPAAPESTVYGTAENAVKVKLTIKNPDYVAPTVEVDDEEEDPENPEFFFDGYVEMYVEKPTLQDALQAAALLMNYELSIEEDGAIYVVTIDKYTNSGTSFWEYTINDQLCKKSIAYQELKKGDVIVADFVSLNQQPTTAE